MSCACRVSCPETAVSAVAAADLFIQPCAPFASGKFAVRLARTRASVAAMSAFTFAVKIWLVQMAAYHGFGLWFEYLDRSGRMARYKVRPPERRRYGELLPRVLANQIFILLPSMIVLEAAGLAYVGAAHLPMVLMLLAFAGMTIGHDVVQYVAHRFVLHRPRLMRRLGHAIHHSTGASRAISACYMSGADFFLEIVCPYLIPLVLVGGGGADFIFHALVVAGGAFGGLYEHSGFDFSVDLRRRNDWRRTLGNMLSSQNHIAHHTRGDVSFSDGFGSSNICDTLFGTRFDLVPRR
ncbi:MAG: sterol desaturase family protein [Methylocystis sp.]|nr:sterol desaturase family protein [Methylocystis sp.]